MKLNRVLKIIYFLVIIQLLRIALKNIAFLFITPTTTSNMIINGVFMVIFTIFLIYIMYKKKYIRKLFPSNEYRNAYLIVGLIIFILGLSGMWTRNYNSSMWLTFIYSLLVVPIFEEILFRGVLWEEVKKSFKKDWITYLIITLLFAIWHFGYVDSVVLNSIVGKGSFSLKIMIWKVFTGLCFGIATGLGRLKFKNTFACVLIHTLGNIFGR